MTATSSTPHSPPATPYSPSTPYSSAAAHGSGTGAVEYDGPLTRTRFELSLAERGMGDPFRRREFISRMQQQLAGRFMSPEAFYRAVLDLVDRDPEACGLAAAAV